MHDEFTTVVDDITRLHRETVARWHNAKIDNPYEGRLSVICRQHQFNFQLWHEEDVARSPDVSDARIAGVKRAIDKFNQQRNDWIERIDETLIQALSERSIDPPADVPMNTETPGSAIDRLSIMSLRIYHLHEQLDRTDASDDHRQSVRVKLDRCYRQHHDLARSLAGLLDDLYAGRKQMKLYCQMKMYNDPSLNPYLYDRTQRKAG